MKEYNTIDFDSKDATEIKLQTINGAHGVFSLIIEDQLQSKLHVLGCLVIIEIDKLLIDFMKECDEMLVISVQNVAGLLNAEHVHFVFNDLSRSANELRILFDIENSFDRAANILAELTRSEKT